MANARKIRALMLDWAGTTLDFGSRAPAEVFVEVFRRQGIDVTAAEAREPMGMAKRAHISAVIHMPRISTLWREKFGQTPTEQDIDRLYEDFIPLQKNVLAQHCEMIPGVVRTVQRCQNAGLKITSSTGYTRELMEVVTAEAAKQGYRPEVVLCAEDARAGRPAPWMIFRAAEMVDVYPMREMIVVDDTLVGVQAGVNAGAWTVGVVETGNCMGLSKQELDRLPTADREQRKREIRELFRKGGADFVVDSVAELETVIDQINIRLSQP